MLRARKTLRIDNTLYLAAQWECTGCIRRNVEGARLVIISSLRNAMISTSDIKTRLECCMCGNMILLEPERCHQYRHESVVNIETFSMPSGHEVLDERVNNCMVLYCTLAHRADYRMWQATSCNGQRLFIKVLKVHA